MIVRELVTKLGFNVDNSALNRFERKIDGINQTSQNVAKNLGAVGAKVRNIGLGMSAFITAPLVLAGNAMINAASDAEEVVQRFNVVYRDMIRGADQVADAYARDFGLARSESRELLGTTGDLLTGFGFTQEQALRLADQVGRLGGDLASFNNIQGGTAEAVTRLTKGILGETENLKLLGVVVNQGTQEFKDQVKQIAAQEGLTTQAAKAQVIFNMAMNQSKNALGDFARTSDGYANKLRIFSSRIRDLKESFGAILLPVASNVLGVFTKLVEFFNKLPRPIKTVILAFAGIAAVLGPILLIAGLLLTAFSGIVSSGPALAALAGFIAPLIIPLLTILAIVAAIGFAIWLLIDDFNTWRNEGDSVLGALFGKFENFKNYMKGFANSILNVFKTFWAALRTNGDAEWDAFLDSIGKAVLAFIDINIKAFLKFFEAIGKIAVKGGELLVKAIIKGIKAAPSIGSALFDRAAGFGGSILRLFGGGDDANTESPAVSAERVITNSGGTTNTSSIKNEINQNIKLEVPPGTPEQQQSALKDSAEKIFSQLFNTEITNGLMAVPMGEQ